MVRSIVRMMGVMFGLGAHEPDANKQSKACQQKEGQFRVAGDRG